MKTRRILSLLLTLVMVIGMLPMSAITASAASTEACDLYETDNVTYSDGVTQYAYFSNYLYTVKYANLKDIESLYFCVEYGYLRITIASGMIELKKSDLSTRLKKADLPTTVGGVLNCYCSYTKRVIDTSKPVVIITCIGVNAPTWSWSADHSSCTATFIASANTDVYTTASATVSSATVSAENCLAKDQITYTAKVTFNGTEYTTSKTVDGSQGPHPAVWTAATCTTPKTCPTCGATEGNALGHNWDPATGICKNDSAHICDHLQSSSTETCSICGKALHTHSWKYENDGANKVKAICEGSGTCPLNNDGGYAEITATDATFTGSAITNAAKVTYSDNWVGSKPELSAGNYSNNINAGTANVSITIEGKEISTTFQIDPANISDATITLNPASGEYTGNSYTPSVSIVFNGDTLDEGDDYSISWD